MFLVFYGTDFIEDNINKDNKVFTLDTVKVPVEANSDFSEKRNPRVNGVLLEKIEGNSVNIQNTTFHNLVFSKLQEVVSSPDINSKDRKID